MGRKRANWEENGKLAPAEGKGWLRPCLNALNTSSRDASDQSQTTACTAASGTAASPGIRRNAVTIK